MKTSVWLQHYEKEVQEKQTKNNKSKKWVYFMAPAIFLLFIVLMIANGAMATPEGRQGIYMMLGAMVFAMAVVVLSMRAAKKKDGAKYTRNDLQQLLLRDEDVDLFDQQMSVAPEFETTIGAEDVLFMTPDFVGESFMNNGIRCYRFCYRRDVKSFHYIKGHSTSLLITDFSYDVRNAYNEIVFNGSVTGKKKIQLIQDFFQKAYPDLEIVKEKWLGR